MNRLAGLLAVAGFGVLALGLSFDSLDTQGSAALALGFTLLISHQAGLVARTLGLPAITGYLLVGLFCGPYLLARVHPALAVLGSETVKTLRLFDAMALGMIALGAGGELRLKDLRANGWKILTIILGQVGIVLPGIAALVWFGAPWLGLGEQGPTVLAVTALMFGVVALTNSPAIVMAVLHEYRPRGPVTDTVLAVVVSMDVVVISLFTLSVSFGEFLLRPTGGLNAGNLLWLSWEILGSLGAGALLGWLVSQYLERSGSDAPLLILGVSFLAVTALPELHLSGILALMVAGFFIENTTRHGEALFRSLDRHSLPVYLVFFTMAGAGINLDALRTAWPLALALVSVRFALIYAGTGLGTWVSKAGAAVKRYAWSGFVAQAGITLGLVVLVEKRLPELGGRADTAMLAVVALNQVIGPILFRLGLSWSGEISPGKLSKPQPR